MTRRLTAGLLALALASPALAEPNATGTDACGGLGTLHAGITVIGGDHRGFETLEELRIRGTQQHDRFELRRRFQRDKGLAEVACANGFERIQAGGNGCGLTCQFTQEVGEDFRIGRGWQTTVGRYHEPGHHRQQLAMWPCGLAVGLDQFRHHDTSSVITPSDYAQ